MNNITSVFSEIYLPKKALVVYHSIADSNKVYVEAYDMDDNGMPINAHPLSVPETTALAECLNASDDLRSDFLISRSLLPDNVLYVSSGNTGCAIWYTPQQRVDLLFKKKLSIPNGKANVPAMVWKASRSELSVYAMKTDKKPVEQTPLYHAPFFNVYEEGNVCMGTVDIEIDNKCCLEDFIAIWQGYFWNSYFNHLIGNASPVKGNIVQLWQGLVNTDKTFPKEVLIKNGKTVKNLIV